MLLRNLRLTMRQSLRFAETKATVALPVNGKQSNVMALSKQKLIKKSLLFLVPLFIFTSVALKAQSPQKINFQSIVRNNSGAIVSNKSVNFKITILSGTITGTPLYSETHLKTTDAIGLVSLQIGTGTVSSGVFSSIDWGNTLHFIKLEADFSGGNTYVTLGTQELMSVPYAMYAAKTDTASLNLTNRFATKAPVNNPTFTGTVGGITKAMVDGLENVNNTSDVDKLVSTATQAALDMKFNKSEFPRGSSANEILYWNGTNWVSLAPGTTGQALIMSSTGLSWGCIITNRAAAPSTTPSLSATTPLTPITIATTGATGIGSASGLPLGVTAAWSANVITISGTPAAAGNFNYTIPLTGGCGTASATGTITANPAPVCPSTSITYNSYTYNTVAIGTQCWMAENLRTRKYNDGTDIPFDASGGVSGNGSDQTWSVNYGAHTLYAHDSTANPSKLTSYGYLYNWYAVDSRKLCPEGWHVPTKSDWNKLVKSIDSAADTTFSTSASIYTIKASTSMKKNDDLWTTNTGTNTSGFSALPGGYRYGDGIFLGIREGAFFWSATSYNTFAAWYSNLSNDNGYVIRLGGISSNYDYKSVGASVRCLRD